MASESGASRNDGYGDMPGAVPQIVDSPHLALDQIE